MQDRKPYKKQLCNHIQEINCGFQSCPLAPRDAAVLNLIVYVKYIQLINILCYSYDSISNGNYIRKLYRAGI